jgi:glycosyltransferase involved in cell wall biosynthesis
VLTSTFPRWRGDSEPPFVFELCQRLAERFNVLVLAPHAPGAKLHETIGPLEVRRFRYFFTPWESLAYRGGIMANLKQNWLRYLLIPFFMAAEFASVVSLLRKHRIDAIHAHWVIPHGVVAIAARALIAGPKPAIVCTSHGSDLLGLTGRMFEWLQKAVISRVDKLTVVSAALREEAMRLVDRGDVEVIPMGTDLTRTFTPPLASGRSDYELLFVGRLVEQKGVQYLVAAMGGILARHPQTILTIVGDGPARENLQRLVETSGLGACVRFLGSVENSALNELYERATVFVSPSLTEGFGLTLVEAMGCACAVVATDLPAVRGIVVDGLSGLLCTKGESADIAAKVCTLLDHPDLRERMGHAGREHVRSFDWVPISRRYIALIDELVRKRS